MEVENRDCILYLYVYIFMARVSRIQSFRNFWLVLRIQSEAHSSIVYFRLAQVTNSPDDKYVKYILFLKSVLFERMECVLPNVVRSGVVTSYQKKELSHPSSDRRGRRMSVLQLHSLTGFDANVGSLNNYRNQSTTIKDGHLSILEAFRWLFVICSESNRQSRLVAHPS